MLVQHVWMWRVKLVIVLSNDDEKCLHHLLYFGLLLRTHDHMAIRKSKLGEG